MWQGAAGDRLGAARLLQGPGQGDGRRSGAGELSASVACFVVKKCPRNKNFDRPGGAGASEEQKPGIFGGGKIMSVDFAH